MHWLRRMGIGLLNAWAIGYMAAESNMGLGQTQPMALDVPASGIMIGQLLYASLAAVHIGSEYGTGMISTTMTAAPRRSHVLLAKVLVMSAVAFVIGSTRRWPPLSRRNRSWPGTAQTSR